MQTDLELYQSCQLAQQQPSPCLLVQWLEALSLTLGNLSNGHIHGYIHNNSTIAIA